MNLTVNRGKLPHQALKLNHVHTPIIPQRNLGQSCSAAYLYSFLFLDHVFCRNDAKIWGVTCETGARTNTRPLTAQDPTPPSGDKYAPSSVAMPQQYLLTRRYPHQKHSMNRMQYVVRVADDWRTGQSTNANPENKPSQLAL